VSIFTAWIKVLAFLPFCLSLVLGCVQSMLSRYRPVWAGDSRGRWEGDTLVVETVNFSDKFNFRGAGPSMKPTERFSRPDADTLLYEFTITDQTVWTKPWTVQLPMTKNQGGMFEYACHEGSHGMFGILSGARADDVAAQAK
jgi:hypothetical protein